MEINGLPLHPLVVHAVVVLGPLAALTGLAYAFVPRWRWLLRWPLLVLALVTAVAALVATSSGESLLEARPGLETLVEDHQDQGELMRNASFAYAAAAAFAAWALGGSSPLASGWGAREANPVLGVPAMALVAVAAVALLVLLFPAGESGARAVWG
ncbi:DUF2231 domain-containing protein [Nocardioides sp. Soil805]|uniref:DUF2231 domain-containing protein n=1 Tax=Nocardioides sp. Soil805 TaxID=1736416 RepID=UPI0007033957|nr:DUF2231 domain-containing protein [Nocardioides sp. Soil805]KRF30339.1 hypothetical protein ASG94_20255 [Nocardioides sp. Soil805]